MGRIGAFGDIGPFSSICPASRSLETNIYARDRGFGRSFPWFYDSYRGGYFPFPLLITSVPLGSDLFRSVAALFRFMFPRLIGQFLRDLAAGDIGAEFLNSFYARWAPAPGLVARCSLLIFREVLGASNVFPRSGPQNPPPTLRKARRSADE